MKLTIIPSDKSVYVDNFSISGFDLSFIPQNVHALQWKDESGWIEFVENDDLSKPANERIFILPDWAQTAYNLWVAQKAQIDADNNS